MSVDQVNDMTRSHFSAQWLKNAVANGRLTTFEDLEHIHSFPDARQAIICGTGPSLNKDFDALQAIAADPKQRHTLIVANHSNLATLLFKGIVPHLVVIADSGDPTLLRLKRDVLPHFKSDLKRQHTIFILPTHAHPDLVRLLLVFHMPIYYYLSLFRILEGDTQGKLYNDAVFAAVEPFKEVQHTCILQAGSVSNASVLVCNALKLLGKAPLLDEVRLSGVDYSYSGYITRCMQVAWSAEERDFDVEEFPTYLGEEIRKVKYNGLVTSEEQVAYYRDLRFIYWNLVEQVKPEDRIFNITTTTDNFVSDFLPVNYLT